VNMPARTVCFHELRKFDGVEVRPLRTRDYGQMAGRAGRQGLDAVGHVFAIYDERFVDWRDLERLQSGSPEPVRSRFNLAYSTILNLYDHVGDRVSDAWRRSFARWHGPASASRPRRSAASGSGGVPERTLLARLEILRGHDYLKAGRLTRKGRMTAKMR